MKYFKMILTSIAVVMPVLTAATTGAFWTDMAALESGVKALRIGIDYNEDKIFLDGECFMPGDSRELCFTVKNSGDISVDIRPVITIEASKDMTAGNNFMLTDADGTEISGYEKAYYDENDCLLTVADTEVPQAYRKVKYTLREEMTLGGNEQKEEAEGEAEDIKEFSYLLSLNRNCGNEMKDASASLEVSTFAIQHRNRKGEEEEWRFISEGA